MKNLMPLFLLIMLLTITKSNFAQGSPEPIDDIVFDEEGNPLYLRNEMIIKFRPDLVNTSVVNNIDKQSGTVSEFIDPVLLEAITANGYFNENLANLTIRKIHRNMTTEVITTQTRIGETMDVPEFWSTFLIDWNDEMTGVSWEEALDTFNNMWPIIEYAHPNYIALLTVLPDDAKFINGDQAGLYPTSTIANASINIDPAWDLTLGKDNCRVGVYDTGINWDHEDYSENSSSAWSNSRVKGGWDWIFNRHPSTTTTADDEGHGSACAGIIGAIRNNDKGIAGIAGGNGASNQWGVQLYSMKLFKSDGLYATTANLVDAITEGATSSNGSYGYTLNVMNCSWYLRQPDINALVNAVRYSFKNKVVMSFASGNTGDGTAQYPSSYRDEWVLKVGANDATGNRASFSTTGNNIDFIAPGTQDIYATTDALSNTTYNYSGNGTSFAAPHASGTAALMLSYVNSPSNAPNNLAPEDVENLLQIFASNNGNYDNNTGFGRINAGATLQGVMWPIYEVRHYNQTFNNNAGTKIGTNVTITVAQGENGVAAGTYFGDVYEVTSTFNITQPSGRNIIDVWKRNSSSTLYANQPVISESNCNVVSWNQTSAVMKGYIFHIKSNIMAQSINRWMPTHGLNGTGTMSLTVYSQDPLANSLDEKSIDKNLIRIIPNPSNGNFKVQFALLKNTDLHIEITDLTGKIVYSNSIPKSAFGHQEVDLKLQHLNAGLFFCNIITAEGIFSQKLSIVK